MCGKSKDVLSNKYGIYKANLYDQRGLVSRPFTYQAGHTHTKGKDGKLYKNVRPSRFIREKKERLLKAQAIERKKVIKQINKEFAPRFDRLKTVRTIDTLKAEQLKDRTRQKALVRINQKGKTRFVKDQESQKPIPPRNHTTSQRRQTARYKLESRQREQLYAFESRTADKKSQEQDKLNQFYKPAEHKRKLQQAQIDLDTHQGMFSRVTGKTKALKQNVEALSLNLESLEQTREQTMSLFTSKVSQERHALIQTHQVELAKFDKQPIQKTGTTKTFEKTVLKKSVGNQNTDPSKTPTAQKEKVSGQSEFKKAVLSHESQKETTANDNTKTEDKARTRNRSKERTKRKERTRSKGREP